MNSVELSRLKDDGGGSFCPEKGTISTSSIDSRVGIVVDKPPTIFVVHWNERNFHSSKLVFFSDSRFDILSIVTLENEFRHQAKRRQEALTMTYKHCTSSNRIQCHNQFIKLLGRPWLKNDIE